MPPPPAPSDLRDHAGYWLRMVSNAVSNGFARKVQAEGVTVAEWVVLRMLFDVDEIRPSQLSARMGMTRGAISKLADRLLAKALVARRPGGSDGRSHALALTPAGRQLVPRLAGLADDNDAEFFGVLDAGERSRLVDLLQAIVSRRELTSIPVD